MIPWIQVYSNIMTHDKTYTLASELSIPNYSAVGLMVSLWCWVAVNAPDGDITNYPPRAISDATGWGKKPDTLYKAMVTANLIEETPDGRKTIRNWENYGSLLTDLMESQKKKTAERVRRHREKIKKRAEGVTETGEEHKDEEPLKRNGNVTVTQSNALPNPTLPNPTLPNHISISDDDGEGASGEGARALVDEYFDQRDLNIDRYFGVDESIKNQAREITTEIFRRLAHKDPTESDVARVFHYTSRSDQTPAGWIVSFPKEQIDLLLYCFEAADSAGYPGKWSYIEGCWKRLHQRGITTLDQAEDYDLSREGGL